ncbi:MAG: hypothetical protein H7Y04_15865 [Verrucomicrobia bacterium]|nr:hypothetical protein [Cytophagales bacterium]
MKAYLSLLLFLSAFGVISAQNIPLGTWRTHASYSQTASVSIADQTVFAGTSGGLYTYDLETNSSRIFSKLDGFSETEILKVKYEPTSQTLVIVYSNGNIDLLKENIIKNLNFIQQSTVFQDKRINQINISGQQAYLAFNFGVVVLDLQRQEIKETWRNLGDNGTEIAILGSAFTQDSIFLATSQGVRKASRNANLQDFNSWKTDFFAFQTIKTIATDGNIVFVGIENNGIFKYDNGSWTNLGLVIDRPINNLIFSGNTLFIC